MLCVQTPSWIHSLASIRLVHNTGTVLDTGDSTVPAPKATLLLGRSCGPELLYQYSGLWGDRGCICKRELSRVSAVRPSEASAVYKSLICWAAPEDLEGGRRWGWVRLHSWRLASGRAWRSAGLYYGFQLCPKPALSSLIQENEGRCWFLQGNERS